ncbi:unnamed protein product [Taenia asiatica]|uniref:Centrosomal protein of 162 kDa n=1 Tax=Taenia asiatica TaxID=60517 RepID=A0A0R3W8H3_TAEAS|nr:unnamed protein product [Taenia asiatica]
MRMHFSFSTFDMNWSDEISKWCKEQNLRQSTESLTRLLLEQLKEQHLQVGLIPNTMCLPIAEMRANEARHQSGIEDIRKSYDKELLRLQTLLTKRQVLNQLAVALTAKLASTLIPSEDANAIAERLVHENARLQIDFQQVKDELNALKSAQGLASMKENTTHDTQEELKRTLRRLEEESRLNGELQDTLQKLEGELKQTREEQSRLQKLLSTADSKWTQEVKDRQRRIVTLNTELKRVRQDYIAAMQRVQEKVRWQNYTQSISSRHVSTIKKQVKAITTKRITSAPKLEIMKLKVELEKAQSVKSSRSKDHNFSAREDIRRYSALVKELQVELGTSHQRVNRLETQLNTLTRVHIAVITGKSPNDVSKWDCDIGKRELNLEKNINNGRLVGMEDESSASYWRSIAEKRTNDVALLGREVDKLTNLLEEISTRKSLTTGLSSHSSERTV